MISSSSSFSDTSSILACLVEDEDDKEDEQEVIYLPLIARACFRTAASIRFDPTNPNPLLASKIQQPAGIAYHNPFARHFGEIR